MPAAYNSSERKSNFSNYMYAARRRQNSVERKFQLGKLCIGQQFQLFNDLFRQFPQGGFIWHQVALHQPQFVDKPQPDAEQEGDSLRFCPAFYCSLPSGFYKKQATDFTIACKCNYFPALLCCHTVRNCFLFHV